MPNLEFAHKFPGLLSEDEIDEVARLYVKQEWSMKKIGEHYKVSVATIIRALDKRDIQRRRGNIIGASWGRPKLGSTRLADRHLHGCPGFQWHDGLGLPFEETPPMFEASCRYFAHHSKCEQCKAWKRCDTFEDLSEEWMRHYYNYQADREDHPHRREGLSGSDWSS